MTSRTRALLPLVLLALVFTAVSAWGSLTRDDDQPAVRADGGLGGETITGATAEQVVARHQAATGLGPYARRGASVYGADAEFVPLVADGPEVVGLTLYEDDGRWTLSGGCVEDAESAVLP